MESEILENSFSRSDIIHEKGFDMMRDVPTEYRKIKVGVKNLEDATLNLGSIKNRLPTYQYTNKKYIYKALAENDVAELRNISNFYYNINGMYQRVCNYFAFLYRYDWYVQPEQYDDDVNQEKLLKEYGKILQYLDNSHIRKISGDIALSAIKEGVYYGYIVPSNTGLVLQQLPANYCRSRYSIQNMPAVEFNMKYFDTFSDPAYRIKVLKMFPEEFAKGYVLYKEGKLREDGYTSSEQGWYLLEPENTVKFSFYNNDIPLFVNCIPYLLDLDAAQDLDRRKQMQKLLKIIVQKLPVDKNGDLIFDVDEARDIHNNAVEMLSRAIGVDVLTTFSEVQSIDLSDKNTATSVDDLEKSERTVFNSLGISRNLFNTDGNMALDKSISNDESTMRNFLLQLSIFFDRITKARSSRSNKYSFRLSMLETTQYNYKDLSKMYKEQTQLGFSKLLPQIALGHSQSFILNSILFENEVLHLSEIMLPPLMSSTLNREDLLGKKEQSNTNNTQKNTVKTEDKKTGRPEKADDQKSDKTIANIESKS